MKLNKYLVHFLLLIHCQGNKGGLDIPQLLKKVELCDLICIGDASSREDSSVISNASTEGMEFNVSENWQLIASLGTETHGDTSQRK